jgi:perosamine synthetase
MIKSKIHYTKPSITEVEISYASDAVENGWGEDCYKYIELFEEAFKGHLGVKYSISTSSCTGALHMGLFALGIGLGDEVILADTNWIASVAPVIHLGATPVFVDILEDTWCLDPELVERAITKNTKAIIAVHLYGNLANMDELISISKKYNIPLIEDSAEAIGSVYKTRKAGSMGRFGVFSFHGTKTLTTGEGGMFVTNDKCLYEHVLTLSNHGRSVEQKKQFFPDMIGFKYKMSNIQAAIGYGQIERVGELINRKRSILLSYKQALCEFDGINLNPEPKGVINGAWMPTVYFDKKLGVTSEILQKEFSRNNIDARVFFQPLSSLAFLKKTAKLNNKFAYEIPNTSINLPSYHDMTVEDIERVVNVCTVVYKNKYI